jgi:hypothetical protein
LRRFVLLTGAVAAALTAAHAVGARRPWPPRHAPRTFSISGHVDDLAPGARSTLRLVIRNPWRRGIHVRAVTVRVDPSGRPCPVTTVRIARFRGDFFVRARSSRRLQLAARLRRSAPAACAGAVFPLAFSGRARIR